MRLSKSMMFVVALLSGFVGCRAESTYYARIRQAGYTPLVVPSAAYPVGTLVSLAKQTPPQKVMSRDPALPNPESSPITIWQNWLESDEDRSRILGSFLLADTAACLNGALSSNRLTITELGLGKVTEEYLTQDDLNSVYGQLGNAYYEHVVAGKPVIYKALKSAGFRLRYSSSKSLDRNLLISVTSRLMGVQLDETRCRVEGGDVEIGDPVYIGYMASPMSIFSKAIVDVDWRLNGGVAGKDAFIADFRLFVEADVELRRVTVYVKHANGEYEPESFHELSRVSMPWPNSRRKYSYASQVIQKTTSREDKKEGITVDMRRRAGIWVIAEGSSGQSMRRQVLNLEVKEGPLTEMVTQL